MNALLALPDLQPERLFVQSGDVRLAVHCWGSPDNDKPTLLMVHGYPDNHETWLPLIRQLAGRYRIVAYDVRGAGASDKPRWSRDYHLQRLSEDLQAVIRATTIASFVYAGAAGSAAHQAIGLALLAVLAAIIAGLVLRTLRAIGAGEICKPE